MTKEDETYLISFLKLIGVGFVILLVFVFVFNHTRSEEYSKLSFKDSLNNTVQVVEKDRSISFVTFDTEKKYKIDWAQNSKYENFTNLSDVINVGDLIVKKSFSDTITVKHSGKEYTYILRQVIK